MQGRPSRLRCRCRLPSCSWVRKWSSGRLCQKMSCLSPVRRLGEAAHTRAGWNVPGGLRVLRRMGAGEIVPFVCLVMIFNIINAAPTPK